MTSKEIIKRIIHHDSPERLGMDFLCGYPSDIKRISGGKYVNPKYSQYQEFGEYPELLAKVPFCQEVASLTDKGEIEKFSEHYLDDLVSRIEKMI